MIAASESGIRCKPFLIQENWVIVNKVDATLDVPCTEELLKNLSFLCHLEHNFTES
jgi:hypothetical protein